MGAEGAAARAGRGAETGGLLEVTPPGVEFRVLGPVQVRTAGRPMALGDRKQRLVLAILLLEVNQLVPVERLVDLLWPEVPPPSARRTLQAHLSRLRAGLARVPGISLVRYGAGYQLDCDRRRVDAHEFRRLFDLAQHTGDDQERADLLDRALGLWHGPALADVLTDELRLGLCHGLQSLRLAAVEERAETYLRLGRHLSLLNELTDLAARYPYRQRITAALMTTLYRTGNTAEALDAYRRTRVRLNDELGLAPPQDLERLHLAILRGEDRLPG